MKKIIDTLKNSQTLKSIGVNIIINFIVIAVMLVLLNRNQNDSVKFIESTIQKQEAVHVEHEKEKEKEIESKLSTIYTVKKQNAEIVTRIKKAEKKLDVLYTTSMKKLNKKYDKEIKDVSNTSVDSTSSILSRLLKDSIN